MKAIYIKPEIQVISVADELMVIIATSSGEGIAPGMARSGSDMDFDDDPYDETSERKTDLW